jgi:phosphoserine phosphatase SerB
MLPGYPGTEVNNMKNLFKLVLFDMDETLLKGRTIHVVGEKKGFKEAVVQLEESSMVSYKKNKMIAQLLKNIKQKELLTIFRSIPLHDHVEEVIQQLNAQCVQTAIVTNSYQLLADDLRKRLGMNYAVGNILPVHKGIITGELIFQNTLLQKVFDGCKIHPICKRSVVDYFCEKLKIQATEIIAVGDGKIDICMLEKAGLGIAYNASVEVQQHADIATDDLRVILQYI